MINYSFSRAVPIGRAQLLIAVAVFCILPWLSASAQTKKTASAHVAISPSLQSLDQWIVMRFRDVQLLPDSSERGSASSVSDLGAPRIEASRNAGKHDTVVAVHYSPTFWRPTLTAGAKILLADPAGVVSAITGKIAARRAFRAPRISGARDTVGAEWRIGWAYLIAIPARMANAAPAGFDGWAILAAPSKISPKVQQFTP
ncbi:MAG: hypothetical protein ABJB66_05025 [Gemmatimonadaceae bacterium]